jgi:hypothetical protein
MYLPLVLCGDSPRRAVRLLGLAWFVVMYIPALALAAPILAVLLIGTMIEETWNR